MLIYFLSVEVAEHPWLSLDFFTGWDDGASPLPKSGGPGQPFRNRRHSIRAPGPDLQASRPWTLFGLLRLNALDYFLVTRQNRVISIAYARSRIGTPRVRHKAAKRFEC